MNGFVYTLWFLPFSRLAETLMASNTVNKINQTIESKEYARPFSRKEKGRERNKVAGDRKIIREEIEIGRGDRRTAEEEQKKKRSAHHCGLANSCPAGACLVFS